jgi:hypothetical protein
MKNNVWSKLSTVRKVQLQIHFTGSLQSRSSLWRVSEIAGWSLGLKFRVVLRFYHVNAAICSSKPYSFPFT